jgi:ribosome biogenesis GTPase
VTNKRKKKRKRQIKKQQREATRAEKAQTRIIRHNTAANQEKHRPDWHSLDPNEEGVIADRRIMPRDERARREQTLAASQVDLAADFDNAHWQNLADETPFLLGVVVEVGRGLCRVSVNDEVIVCDIRGILTAEGSGYTNILAVGDRVLVRPLADDRGLIEGVLPRRSGLARADTFHTHLKQIIAANVDQLLIVASWLEPHIWFQMIDEYLIGAARNNLATIICINKIDLAHSLAEVETAVAPYHSLQYQLLFTSAVTGQGLDQLQRILGSRTTVLAGLSGVGKSTLLNAIEPGMQLRTGVVSDLKSREGRHTTTQAIMLPLSFGGYVVDTPGIKDMGLIGLYADELIEFYPDVAAIMGQCRFSDCSHSHEPGCAVKTAVAAGTLADWRHQNYTNLYRRLEAESTALP